MATNITRVTLTDNADLIRRAADEAIQRALERVGQFVEDEAKHELQKDPPRIDTGALRNSITHTVKGRTVIVGTNLKYGIYVHEGTGKYNSSGSTGDKYWVFVTGELSTITDRQRRKSKRYVFKRNFIKFVKTIFYVKNSGKRYTFDEAKKVVAILRSNGLDAHMTNGMKPNRFLRNAIMNNIDKLRDDVEKVLKGER